MLVAGGTDKVDAIDISPVPGLGQDIEVHLLMWTWRGSVNIECIVFFLYKHLQAACLH